MVVANRAEEKAWNHGCFDTTPRVQGIAPCCPHRPVDFGYDGPDDASVDEVLERQSSPINRFIDWQVNIAGHTHGGLWRLPIIGPVIHPNLGWFPPDEVTYRLHPDKDGRRSVWISSGLAAKTLWYASFRVFNPPEIAVLTLSTER